MNFISDVIAGKRLIDKVYKMTIDDKCKLILNYIETLNIPDDHMIKIFEHLDYLYWMEYCNRPVRCIND